MIPVLIIGTIIAGGIVVYYMAKKPREYPVYNDMDWDSLTNDQQNALWEDLR